MLGQFADEAKLRFREASEAPGDSGPWVWADPANCFLIPFWAHTLGIRVGVVLVHRKPEDVVSLGRLCP